MHCCITVYSEVCACRPSPPPLLSSRVAFQVSCETAADKGLVEFHPLGSLLLYGGLFKSLRGHTTRLTFFLPTTFVSLILKRTLCLISQQCAYLRKLYFLPVHQVITLFEKVLI